MGRPSGRPFVFQEERMPQVTSHVPGTFCWIELGTSDASSATDFYTRLFGWTTRDIPMGETGNYTMLLKDGSEVAALYENNKMPPNWLSYVAVESADDASKTARDLGANVMGDPFDVFDAGRMAVITDPQGATCAV